MVRAKVINIHTTTSTRPYNKTKRILVRSVGAERAFNRVKSIKSYEHRQSRCRHNCFEGRIVVDGSLVVNSGGKWRRRGRKLNWRRRKVCPKARWEFRVRAPRLFYHEAFRRQIADSWHKRPNHSHPGGMKSFGLGLLVKRERSFREISLHSLRAGPVRISLNFKKLRVERNSDDEEKF